MGVLSPASLHPPVHGGGGSGGGGDGANGARPSWILLDAHAYIADRRNSSTATCKFMGDKQLQVTFFPAHPPRFSYFCVHCFGLKSSAYAVEPKIIAMEANLVLFRIAFGSRKDLFYPTSHEYFIYRADGGDPNGRPLLEQLPHPMPYVFHHDQVGLLSCGTDYTVVALRDDSAAIYRRDYPHRPGHYDVCTLHSKDKGWTIKAVNVPLQERQKQSSDDNMFHHVTSKVITIGGKSGTMAFVDLWRGILQYDVLGGSPLLRYTPLPEICPGMKDYSVSPSLTRDIAVVRGCIKYVAVEMVKDGWKAATWSMPISISNLEDTWLPPCELEACNICDDKNLVCSQLLPKLNYKKVEPPPTLATLSTGYPTLSLYEDDMVYFMTKVKPMDTKACVIAVDMKSRKLEGLAEFNAKRMLDMKFSPMQSSISSYLKVVPGAKKRAQEKGKKYLLYGLPSGARIHL